LIVIIGLSSGIAVSAGLFAFVVALGIVNKTASNLGVAKYIYVFEYMVIAGATIWNILYIFTDVIYGGYVSLTGMGLFFGIYVGLLSYALAEVTKVVPILALRLNWSKGLVYVALATALGKSIGSLFGLVY
jgi:stage V sporulation protein AB